VVRLKQHAFPSWAFCCETFVITAVLLARLRVFLFGVLKEQLTLLEALRVPEKSKP
jgi:hypothetical protein